jgi:hypothetical protein
VGLTGEEDDTPVRILAALLETAVLVGDVEPAALIAPKLASIHGTDNPLRSVALLVGQAYALLGDREGAWTQYERSLEWTTRIRFRPEIALTRLAMAELLLPPLPLRGGGGEGVPHQRTDALAHLDFAIEEFRAMKMQPSLERALRHKGLLRA